MNAVVLVVVDCRLACEAVDLFRLMMMMWFCNLNCRDFLRQYFYLNVSALRPIFPGDTREATRSCFTCVFRKANSLFVYTVAVARRMLLDYNLEGAFVNKAITGSNIY